MAVYIGLLDLDIRVTDPPELVERLRDLAKRYAAAVGTGDSANASLRKP